MSAPPIFAALDPQASAWVGANAGAGKTYILVSRLARLMLDGVLPERILCLTYTRAAAAEMQSRLFDLLAAWALMDDDGLRGEIKSRLGCAVDDAVLQRARILFARALETPGGLRVQTIHGFCESLLKRFPLEAGLSPHFDLLDEQEARHLQTGLIADLLTAGTDPALMAAMAQVTRALSENDILALGRQIIDRRAAFDSGRRDDYLAGLAAAMHLPQPVADRPETLAGFHAATHQLMAAMPAWLAAGGVNDQKAAKAMGDWLAGGPDRAAAQWPSLRAVFLTQAGTMRARLVSKDRVEAEPALAQKLTDLAAQVADLDGQLKALVNYHLSAAVYVFAEALLAAYQAAKTRRAVLDYEDMIAVTRRLLDGPKAVQWVLFKIDSGLHHILIDEAQDTSPAQWQIIAALADGFFDDAGLTGEDMVRTIFAVGDEKQSIFSFQGADPKGFDAQRAHFEKAVSAIGGDFHLLPMRQSRRSAPQILRAVDVVFAAHAQGVTASGAAIAHDAFRQDAVGHVEIWPPCAASADDKNASAWEIPAVTAMSGRQKLADQTADKIAALLADKRQNVTAADILVLVRSRDAFVGALTSALKRKNIAVAGSDRMVLLEQIAIADVLAAVDFALNPLDDMALAIFLRSPLGGFSEAELFAVAAGRQGSLWQALKADESAAAEAARARLRWLRAQVDFLSPYEYLAQFLGAQGGHKALAARLGSEIDDPLHELLQLALSYEARHAGGMQGFVHWLRQGSQEIKRDMEAGGAAVRIMTVHGAKGLEAPIVFLPDTCRPAKKRGGARARMQFDAEKRPLWRANQALRDPYNAAQAAADEEAQAHEEKRLLYVAMTRARDRLYIGGWLGAGETAPPEDSWYAMIDSALDDGLRGELAAGEGPLPRPSTDDAGREGEDEAAANDAQLPTAEAPAWVNTKPAISAQGEAFIGMKIFSPSSLHKDDAAPDRQAVLAEAQGEVQDEAEGEARARKIARGQIIHKILEWVPGLPDEAREKAALALAEKYAATKNDPAAQLDADALKAAVDEALALMRAPELADLFSAAAQAEAAIVGNLPLPDGRQLALAGQIDRMVETDEAIVLVDFKTGMPASDGPVAAGYVTQMAAYRGLIQAAKGTKKPVRCGLVWTQNGHIDWLREADMQAALAAL